MEINKRNLTAQPIAIIINKGAKNAQDADQYLDKFSEANLTYQLYRVKSEELAETIEEIVSQCSLLIVGGGDGTIRTAAQFCAGTKTVLGVLPLGTLNHFSKELDFPQTPQEMVSCIDKFNTLTIDLASVNGKIFINNSSVGIYPRFAKTRDEYTKKYNKWLSYFPSLIEAFKKRDIFKANLTSDTLNLFISSYFLMVSNNPYTIEFPLTFKRKELTRGTLGIYYIKSSKRGVLRLIDRWIMRKTNFVIKEINHPLEIDFPKQHKIKISLDGDWEEMETPLRYENLPQTLTVLVKT